MKDPFVKTRRYPAIPAPSSDPVALLQTVQALKQVVELLAGTRSRVNDDVAAVTWQDLIGLGIVSPNHIRPNDRVR